MSMPLETGSLVEVRGEQWLLTRVFAYGSCTVLALEGRDRGNAKQRLSVIDPFDRARRVVTTKPKRRPRRAVLRSALGAIVDTRSATGLWTAADASIDLLPYHLEPALAAVNGATRLLLADAVGLGKTIQAGLLLSELRERYWVERALIVCPAGLRDTWARELVDRFGIHAAVLDQAAIAERVASLPPGVNPWAGHAVAIASIDFVKRAEVLAALEHEPHDLLIADEAHHLAPGTDRGTAVARLASRATWCVLLSATPHSGDQMAFDYLTRIGARDDPLTIFRRSRTDVGLETRRRPHVLAVRPTADEAALFSSLDRYARAIWHARGRHEHAVKLVAVTLSRRAASSARAIERTLTRRLELLDHPVEEPAQPLLPWEDEDERDGAETDSLLATPGLDHPSEERACLEGLIQLARRCVNSSKLQRLGRLLNRVRESVVIFTEYRDSLEAVVEVLQPSHRVAAIHGGVPIDLRRSAVDAFNDGRLDVLVATDAAGEGLNLHHRCRLVVDLELPWNPLRLEQRVGRVDRLGQRRTVHAIRMLHAGTIEQRVLEHLRLRDRRAQEAFQSHQVTDAMMADAIFEGAIQTAIPASIGGTRISAEDEAQRLESQRRAHQCGARTTNVMSWTAPPNGRPRSMMLLTRCGFVNAAGVFVHGAIEVRGLPLPASSNRRRCRQLIEHERERMMGQAFETEMLTVAQYLDAPRARIRRRILAIRGDHGNRTAEQASLFDRRAETESTLQEASFDKRDRALSRALLAIDAPSAEQTRIELVAAWPEARR